MPANPTDQAMMRTSSVYYGDCFKHLTHWNNWNRWDEDNNARLALERRLADLIYLDPPWNSNANYNILWTKTTTRKKASPPKPWTSPTSGNGAKRRRLG